MSKFGRSVADRREFFRKAMEEEQKAGPTSKPRRSGNFENRRSKEFTRVETKTVKETKTEVNEEKKEDSRNETTEESNENVTTTKVETTRASEKVSTSDDTQVSGETSAESEKPEVNNNNTSPTKREPRVLKKKPMLKRQMSVSSLVLTWCQDVTKEYPGVDIKNFSGSFTNGLAFCALIHKFNPDKFDFDSLGPEDRRHNWTLAVETGLSVGIPALFDIDQMLRLKRPEPRSVQCYVQMIFSKYKPKDLDMSNLIIA